MYRNYQLFRYICRSDKNYVFLSYLSFLLLYDILAFGLLKCLNIAIRG